MVIPACEDCLGVSPFLTRSRVPSCNPPAAQRVGAVVCIGCRLGRGLARQLADEVGDGGDRQRRATAAGRNRRAAERPELERGQRTLGFRTL